MRKRFESPDEVREFEKGRFEIVRLGGMVLGRATYEPGWRWSQHARLPEGPPVCQVEHVCMVIAGRAGVSFENGVERIVEPGDVFYVPPGPPGHDSWVVGDERYVSLHFLGADAYKAQ